MLSQSYCNLRHGASTSKSRHPRGQYRAGDAPGLQPIPEHSGAGNQLTELKAAIKGNILRPEIQVRMDDRAEARCLGIPLGEMRTRLLLDALQRCIGVIHVTAAKAYQWERFMQTYLPRSLINGRKLKANNVLCIYLQSSLHLFTDSCRLCNVFI